MTMASQDFAREYTWRTKRTLSGNRGKSRPKRRIGSSRFMPGAAKSKLSIARGTSVRQGKKPQAIWDSEGGQGEGEAGPHIIESIPKRLVGFKF